MSQGTYRGKLATRDLTGADALRMVADLGSRIVSQQYIVLDKETADQFALETQEQAIQAVTHKTVEMMCTMLGVEAEYSPTTNKFPVHEFTRD